MRRFAGRSCAASSLSMNRGRRPPEAENRAHIPRAIASREAMPWQGCRFGANSFGTEPPRSVLGICTARRAPPKAYPPTRRVALRSKVAKAVPIGCCVSRPRRPRPRGESVRKREARTNADEHTLKGDRPAERKFNQGTMEAHSMQRARRGGVGSPKGNRWRNADARPNAPAPRGNA